MTQHPSEKDIADWHRWFAIEMNNLAWEIAENPARTPEQGEDMLNAAHASALHWSKIGTDLNRARADMLLAQVHGLLEDGPQAMRHAQRCREYFAAHECPDWEIAFVHAVLAHAACRSKNETQHATEHARAKELGDAISDEREKETFLRTFSQIPAPKDLPHF